MTPGAYLRHCREADGLTLDDVALRIRTLPPVDALSRAHWLETIEADDAPLAIATALRLHTIYAFDWDELLALARRQPGRIEGRDDLRVCLRADGAAIRLAAEGAILAGEREASA